MVYRFRPEAGARYRRFDAQLVGEALAQVGATEARAEVVVAAAADPRSVLHGLFEWDDTRAAGAYRVMQARALVRAVVVVAEEAAPARARSVVAAMPGRSPVLRAVQAAGRSRIEQAARELREVRRRYADLEELADVFEAIDLALPRMRAAS